MRNIRKYCMYPAISFIGLSLLLILGAGLFWGCATSKPLLCYYNYAQHSEFTVVTKENHPEYTTAQLKEKPIFVIIDFDLNAVRKSAFKDNITTLIKLHNPEQFYGLLTYSDAETLKGYGKIVTPSDNHGKTSYEFDPRTGEYTLKTTFFEIDPGKTPVEKLASLYTGEITIPWDYVHQVTIWEIKDKDRYADVEEAWQ